MTETLSATLLVDCGCELGEGVLWHPSRRRVYWTDIKRNTLWSCDETGGRIARVALETGLCSFAYCDDGRMLAAFADGLSWLDPVTGRRTLFQSYMPNDPGTRMNDGAVDRTGRFVVGGIDEAGRQPITPVWSVDRGEVREILGGVTIANATAFSPDGSAMYFADTPTGEILRYAYDPATGTPSAPEPFARPGRGVPDGATVDREGALWNAEFGGAGVQRWRADGTPDLRVTLPVPNPTDCTLGGRKLSRLFITTARIEMTAAARAAAPQAGGLYVADVPVPGIAEHSYRR